MLFSAGRAKGWRARLRHNGKCFFRSQACGRSIEQSTCCARCVATLMQAPKLTKSTRRRRRRREQLGSHAVQVRQRRRALRLRQTSKRRSSSRLKARLIITCVRAITCVRNSLCPTRRRRRRTQLVRTLARSLACQNHQRDTFMINWLVWRARAPPLHYH